MKTTLTLLAILFTTSSAQATQWTITTLDCIVKKGDIAYKVSIRAPQITSSLWVAVVSNAGLGRENLGTYFLRTRSADVITDANGRDQAEFSGKENNFYFGFSGPHADPKQDHLRFSLHFAPNQGSFDIQASTDQGFKITCGQ